MNKLIYLAGPYSYDPYAAFELHLFYLAQVMRMGNFVFSPIVHNHHLAHIHDFPHTHEYWAAHNEFMLKRCDELWVMTELNWESSKGTTFELSVAKKLGLPIKYIRVTDSMVSVRSHSPFEVPANG